MSTLVGEPIILGRPEVAGSVRGSPRVSDACIHSYAIRRRPAGSPCSVEVQPGVDVSLHQARSCGSGSRLFARRRESRCRPHPRRLPLEDKVGWLASPRAIAECTRRLRAPSSPSLRNQVGPVPLKIHFARIARA